MCSACCTSALAKGKLKPITIDGSAASTSRGPPLNQISVARGTVPVTVATAASIGRASTMQDAGQRSDHEHRLGEHQPAGDVPRPLRNEVPDQRAHANARQDHRQQKREHCAKSSEENCRVAKPQDFHTERREADQAECQAGENNRSTWKILRLRTGRWLAPCTSADRFTASLRSRHPQRHRERRGPGGHVEGDGGQLRVEKPERGHEREVGQEASECGSRRIRGIQPGDSAGCDRDLVLHEMPDQQRERAAHERRDGEE